jgi:hypothetical protein
MKSFKASVRKGRLVLDEPTELPEGEVVYLAPVEGTLRDDERLAVDASLDQSLSEMAQRIDEQELLAELRSLA